MGTGNDLGRGGQSILMPTQRASHRRLLARRSIESGLPVTLLLLGLLSPSSPGQSDLFPRTPDPIGIVVGQDEQPIEDAEVSFRIADTGVYSRAIRLLLQRQPLPRFQTNSDGSFILPLSRDQRRIGMVTKDWPRSAIIRLVVEKEGYHPWEEVLPHGLGSYLGSKAVLQKISEHDRAQIIVKSPAPSMLVSVTQFGAWGKNERIVSVPADGKLKLELPLFPTPSVVSTPYQRETLIGCQVRLLYPGRTTEARSVDAGMTILWDEEPAGETTTVSCANGADLRGLRGLYRCPNGAFRWFEIEGDALPEDRRLTLIAVCADGMVAVTDPFPDPFILKPVPEQRSAYFKITGVDKQKVEGLRAALFALRDWGKVGDGLPRPLMQLRANASGHFVVPDRAYREPCFCAFDAPGYVPTYYMEPRSIPDFASIRLPPHAHGSLEITARSEDGQAIAGATIFLTNGALAHQALGRRNAVTDAKGVKIFKSLLPGNHPVRVIAEGFRTVEQKVQIEGSEVQRVEIRLQPSPMRKILSINEDGLPVPFVHMMGNTRGQQFATITDSLGRLATHDIPPEVTELRVTSQQPPIAAPIEEEGVLTRIQVNHMPTVVVKLPPTKGLRRRVWKYGRGSSSSSSGHPSPQSPTYSLLLIAWTHGENAEATLGIGEGPPIRLTGAEVFAAQDKAASSPVLFDRRKIQRRLPLQIDGHGRINMALGKTASAMTSQEEHPPEHAFDGDPSTRWCAKDGGKGYWLQVDLGTPQDLASLRIHWEHGGSRYDYRLESSVDAERWTELVLAKPNAATTEIQTVGLTAKAIRYLRVTVLAQEESMYASIRELEVFGKNDKGDGGGKLLSGLLRIEPRSPHHNGGMVSNGYGNMAEQDAQGRWFFVARDRGAYTCTVLHPDYLPAKLEIPASAAGEVEEPLKIPLVAGSRVILRATFQQEISSSVLTTRVQGLGKTSFRLYVQDAAPKVAKEQLGKPFDIPLPCALSPGEFDFRISGLGSATITRKITVKAGQPSVIDLGEVDPPPKRPAKDVKAGVKAPVAAPLPAKPKANKKPIKPNK